MKLPKRASTFGLAGVLTLVLGISVGAFTYLHFMAGEAPARLALGSRDTASVISLEDAPGTWYVTSGSQVGYRVSEVLFGQHAEAVGRTDQVSGSLRIDGTTVTDVELSVDMSSFKSDQRQRDAQFRSRIMAVSRYPTATFKLERPIELTSQLGPSPVAVQATGTLTLHGVSKSLVVDLQARSFASAVGVSGSIPVTFADYDIPNPTFGPAQTEDHGELELLIVFARK